jgi:hypothetical protein
MPSLVKLDESDVVDDLKQSSKEFKNFYEKERYRAGDIEWVFNPNLGEQFVAAQAAHFHHINERCHEICLSKSSICPDDAHLIAHEIVHAILAEENHGLITYRSDDMYKQLDAYLCTMIEDPVVESFLQEEYRFNLSSDYLQKLPIAKRAWDHRVEPIDGLSRIMSASLLANEMMEWRLIKDPDALRIWSDFLSWYSDGRPNIFLIGVRFVAITQKFGLETIKQRKTVFSEIEKEYQLGDILSLENKFCK